MFFSTYPMWSSFFLKKWKHFINRLLFELHQKVYMYPLNNLQTLRGDLECKNENNAEQKNANQTHFTCN